MTDAVKTPELTNDSEKEIQTLKKEIQTVKEQWNRQAKQWNQATLRDAREIRVLREDLAKLRDDIILHAHDTVWVGLAETACERITTILGDDCGKDGRCEPSAEARAALKGGEGTGKC